jgi:hypothetical protein
MTYSLRRKHPTTAREQRLPMRMATSLLGFGLLLHAGAAAAQSYPGPSNPSGSTFASTPYPRVQSPTTDGLATPDQHAPQSLQFHSDAADSGSSIERTSGLGAGSTASTQVVPPPGDKMPQSKSNYEEVMGLKGVREVPGLEKLTRLETEAQLQERMKQEALRAGDRLVFPEEPVLSKEMYPGRHWAPKAMEIEPCYVAHGRLLFEQQNFERGLWDLGPFTPLVSMAAFYFDVAALPYHLGTRPCQQYDTSAGKCLPGDPAPLFLYPPELSFSGAVAELAVGTGLFFVFP